MSYLFWQYPLAYFASLSNQKEKQMKHNDIFHMFHIIHFSASIDKHSHFLQLKENITHKAHKNRWNKAHISIWYDEKIQEETSPQRWLIASVPFALSVFSQSHEILMNAGEKKTVIFCEQTSFPGLSLRSFRTLFSVP